MSTTAIYAWLNLDPVREAMQKATSAMFAAGGLLPAAQVTPIHEQTKKAAEAYCLAWLYLVTQSFPIQV